MSEFTTVARPYAKAAFDFAIEHDQLAQWQTMLGFAAAVVTDDRMQNLLVSDLSANKIADIVIKICGYVIIFCRLVAFYRLRFC